MGGRVLRGDVGTPVTGPSPTSREAADLWLQQACCLLTPEAAVEQAQALALRPGLDDDARASLRLVLQPWWTGCQDARDLLRWAARCAPVRGSPAHRRVVFLAALCARTALPHAGPWREEIDGLLGRVEAWAHGEAVDLAPVRERLWAIRRAANAANAANAAAYAAHAAHAAAAAAAADAAAYANAAAYAAAAAAANAWREARDWHLAALADLIRREVPEVPLP